MSKTEAGGAGLKPPISKVSPDEAPKRRGRPPGSKNKPKEEIFRARMEAASRDYTPSRPVTPTYKMKAKPNWEDLDLDAFGDETPDRFRVAPDLVPDGMSLQWVTSTVRGADFGQRRSQFEKRGWTPVHQSDFDGIFDGMFMKKGEEGEITLEGMVLMTRPEAITRKARMMERFNAEEKIRIKEAALRGGDINTSLDSQHPTVQKITKVNRTMERLEIPE